MPTPPDILANWKRDATDQGHVLAQDYTIEWCVPEPGSLTLPAGTPILTILTNGTFLVGICGDELLTLQEGMWKRKDEASDEPV